MGLTLRQVSADMLTADTTGSEFRADPSHGVSVSVMSLRVSVRSMTHAPDIADCARGLSMVLSMKTGRIMPRMTATTAELPADHAADSPAGVKQPTCNSVVGSSSRSGSVRPWDP